MGAAEAPTKFVTAGITPFLISLGMVGGVFVARWTLPTVLKGTTYVFHDLREKPHLIVWALLAGALWAVANSLSVFAVRDVGLAIAFPLWNTDSLVGLLWGWLFFRELRGAGSAVKMKVLGGSITIILGAILLGYASSLHSGYEARRSAAGIISSLGASVIWGTMFLPYRKAYISGMNPLSFVTIFTIGELITMGSLALAFHGGMEPLMRDIVRRAQSLLLAVSRRILLGCRRLVRELRCKIRRHRPRCSVDEHESALGLGMGCVGVRGVCRPKRYCSDCNHCRLSRCNRGSCGNQLGGGAGSGASRPAPCHASGMQALWFGLRARRSLSGRDRPTH